MARIVGGGDANARIPVDRMLSALGIPESARGAIGARVGSARGEFVGVARKLADLSGSLGREAKQRLFGDLPPAHLPPAPRTGLERGRVLPGGQRFHDPATRTGPDLSPETASRGADLARAIRQDPAFRAQLEKTLGGRVIADGRADGKVTVHRFEPQFPGIRYSAGIATDPRSSTLFGCLSRMDRNAEKLRQSAASTSPEGEASPTRDLAETLCDALLKYGQRQDVDIRGRMGTLFGRGSLLQKLRAGRDATEPRGPTGAGTDSPAGEWIGGALGGAGGAGGATHDGVNYGEPGKMSESTKQQLMQKLTQDLKRMYELLSTMMKNFHDMQMKPIQNMR